MKKELFGQLLAMAAGVILIAGVWRMGQHHIFMGENTNQNIEVSCTPTILKKEEQLPHSIKYKDLKLAKVTETMDNAQSPEVSPDLCWDILAFEESKLADSQSIIEATVEKAYTKKYVYEVEDDKFEKHGKLKCTSYTTIYEICIDYVWYGNYKKGDKIVIEEEVIGCTNNMTLHLEIGRSYVLPLYEGEDTIFLHGDGKVLSGNVKKKSRIQVLYPFHRQIEITLDHKYIAGSDWATLGKEKNKAEVKMDKKENSITEKCYLYTKDTFASYMKKMIKRYLT